MRKNSGFTIVELLVVIVIIAILAVITLVSFGGLSQEASEASLKADLKNASTIIGLDNVRNGIYPATTEEANRGNGLASSPDTTYQYTSTGSSYCLTATSTRANASAYHVSSDGMVEEGVCPGHSDPNNEMIPGEWKQIVAGGEHTCGIAFDDQAYCWGYNGAGQLGNGSTDNSSVPVAVDTTGVLYGKSIESISVDGALTCAIASDGNVYCWGYNGYGQLGNDSYDNSSTPVAVNTNGVLNGKSIKSISVGRFFACAIASDDNAYCWGYNGSGQLGDGTYDYDLVPVAVDKSDVLDGKTVLSISAGGEHTCVVASDNQAYCWGSGGNGRLGNGSSFDNPVPAAVDTTGLLSGKTIKAIFANRMHTCAIASDDNAYCWGDNNGGQLGDNLASGDISLVPVAVDTSGVLNGKTILSITAGTYHTCVIASDNKAYCWGYDNHGQLGDILMSDSPVPVAVSSSGILNGRTMSFITVGDYHSCAIDFDNKAYCWGENWFGNLGNNSFADNTQTPVVVYAPNTIPLTPPEGWVNRQD